MAQYYYLVSSLADIMIDSGRTSPDLRQLFVFCMEEMAPKDFEQVRKLYLLNDIKNTIFLHFNKKEKQEDYVQPAYYDEGTFNENLKDPSLFLPFLTQFYELKKAGKRLYPQLPETDELTSLFYEELDEFTDGFLREYFHFELNLRNITTALALRKNGLAVAGKLIPSGSAYELIGKNESQSDFGLGDEFPFVERLVALNQQSQLLDLEMAVEDIRWKWLDENVGDDYFSTEAILAYFVKLNSVTRWDQLDKERGQELFDGIVNTIKRSIRFSIEFITTGDK